MEKGRVYGLGTGELIAWGVRFFFVGEFGLCYQHVTRKMMPRGLMKTIPWSELAKVPYPYPYPSPSPNPSPNPNPNPNPNPSPSPSPTPTPYPEPEPGRGPRGRLHLHRDEHG